MPGPVEFHVTNNNMRKLGQLDMILESAIETALHRIGQKLKAAAQAHIQAHDLSWAPLSPQHSAFKALGGYSPHIYIMTSTLMQNITYLVGKEGKEHIVIVGVMRSAPPSPVNGTETWKIAEVLEYGSWDGKIPARPLWTPTLEENRRSIQTIIGIQVAQATRKLTGD